MAEQKILRRSTAFHMRDDAADGRPGHVEGVVVPLGVIQRVTDYDEYGWPNTYDEEFDTDLNVVSNDGKLFYNHSENIGTQSVDKRTDSLWGLGDIAVGSTRGHDVYELAKTGAVDKFSIGFVDMGSEIIPAKTRGGDYDLVIRKSVAIKEFSLVDFPAYGGASVESVRNDPNAQPNNQRKEASMTAMSEETAKQLVDSLTTFLNRSDSAVQAKKENRSLNAAAMEVVRKLDDAKLDGKHRSAAMERIARSEEADVDAVIAEEAGRQKEIDDAVADALKQKELADQAEAEKTETAKANVQTTDSETLAKEDEDPTERQMKMFETQRAAYSTKTTKH